MKFACQDFSPETLKDLAFPLNLEETAVEFQPDVKNVLVFAEENWDKDFHVQHFEKRYFFLICLLCTGSPRYTPNFDLQFHVSFSTYD